MVFHLLLAFGRYLPIAAYEDCLDIAVLHTFLRTYIYAAAGPRNRVRPATLPTEHREHTHARRRTTFYRRHANIK